MNTQTILHVNSSSRIHGSLTRAISAQLVKQLQKETGSHVHQRDLADGMPFIDEKWVAANFTDPEQRSGEQKETLKFSDEMVSELKQASHVVIAAPIYNFSVPAVLKAWIDQIARARETFKYTENGPIGLLTGKKAYLVVASGGVPLESDMDFVTPYLKQVMGFIGIDDVVLINANDFNQIVDDDEMISVRLEPFLAA